LAKPATGAKHTPFSLIGGDVTITGDIRASVDLHLDGRVEGNLSCAALVQGQDSVIKGHITAKSVRIGGTVEGSITADELVVEATAHITGDVNYGSISVAQGAEVDGRVTRKAPVSELKLIVSDS
jgi:cytoskeletal protein CcmA (bactofilin family)